MEILLDTRQICKLNAGEIASNSDVINVVIVIAASCGLL